MKNIELNKDVEYILNTLKSNNYEAFIVGGCVRDSLLNKTPKDIDICTNARPEQAKELFDKTFDSGIAHGTITVVLSNENYEITTFRKDGISEDCRHPNGVVFIQDINEDLARRDFTINAIAFNKDVGFVDPFEGVVDIQNKLIKAVFDPNKRFNEDALRMLRAIRFSAVLGFEIDEKTYEAIKTNASLIKNVSIERIREEFLKTLKGDVNKLKLFTETKLFSFVNNEFHSFLENNIDEIINDLNYCSVDNRLVMLFRLFDKSKLTSILKFFKFDNKTIKEIVTVLNNLDSIYLSKYSISKLVNKIGKEFSLIVFDLLSDKDLFFTMYDQVKDNPLTIRELDIKGTDLKDFKGEEIGLALNFLMDEVLKNPSLNNKKTLLSLLNK